MARQHWVGYCTNVHAGSTLEQTEINLKTHTARVQEILGTNMPLGIGLWLSASTAASLVDDDQVQRFSELLSSNQWIPYTINGFPYGDFHREIVKHDVYRPTWWEPERLEYTLNLIHVLHKILPEGHEGSISTLPIGWPSSEPTEEQLGNSATQLISVVKHLAKLEQETGRLIYVCIEPEPGCILDTTEDMIRFFEEYLFANHDSDQVRRYLRVCHDICHAAVMFEDQSSVVKKYNEAGIQIGKVQVSSAIELRFKGLSSEETNATLARVSQFAEDRYLHQTTIRKEDGSLQYFEDLPFALNQVPEIGPQNETWRIHFHLPIYLDQAGPLQTTQSHIHDFLSYANNESEIKHFEVETYAWSVLPQDMQHAELAEGIAQEISWLQHQLPS